MSEQPPKLAQLNLLVDDMAASLDFYRRLGVATADEDGGPHAELSLPGGFTLELDTVESAGLWHAGVRADPASGRVATCRRMLLSYRFDVQGPSVIDFATGARAR